MKNNSNLDNVFQISERRGRGWWLMMFWTVDFGLGSFDRAAGQSWNNGKYVWTLTRPRNEGPKCDGSGERATLWNRHPLNVEKLGIIAAAFPWDSLHSHLIRAQTFASLWWVSNPRPSNQPYRGLKIDMGLMGIESTGLWWVVWSVTNV